MNHLSSTSLHVTLDIRGCRSLELFHSPEWIRMLDKACEIAKLEILDRKIHQFEPFGLTGMYLLSTSHISFHTWPEFQMVCIDVFSCGPREDTERAVAYLKDEFSCAEEIREQRLDRGFPTLLPLPYEQKYEVHESFQSKHQKVEVVTLPDLGKCLILDGIVQASERDYHLYNSAIMRHVSEVAHPCHSGSDILVIGGGDGLIARDIDIAYPHLRTTIVEMDKAVVLACAKHLGTWKHMVRNDEGHTPFAMSSNDSVLSEAGEQFLLLSDASTFLSSISSNQDVLKHPTYSIIIVDWTDMPIGEEYSVREHFFQMYERFLPFLAPGGWISVEMGSVRSQENSVRVDGLIDAFHKLFSNVEVEHVDIPSFSDTVGFIHGQKAVEDDE